MKRSEINGYIKEAETFFREHRFVLPPWGYWNPTDWRRVERSKMDEIVDHGLGWDLTDFGGGDFSARGLLLFTMRNGSPDDPARTYAEKIMVVKEGQITPLHFHWRKTEDIIVRGGGNLVVEMYFSDENERTTTDTVTVSVDGVRRTVEAGESVRLGPGESVTLTPRLYHRFYGAAGKGTVLVGVADTRG
jgi:D-lyxose ketol-isomerase